MKLEAVVPQYRGAPAPHQIESLVDSVLEMAETNAYNQSADEGRGAVTGDAIEMHAQRICDDVLSQVRQRLEMEHGKS